MSLRLGRDQGRLSKLGADGGQADYPSCGRSAVTASITAMPAFRAPDGTELAYHVHGEGVPLVCLPGGPLRESAYLGDLGGLSVTGS